MKGRGRCKPLPKPFGNQKTAIKIGTVYLQRIQTDKGKEKKKRIRKLTMPGEKKKKGSSQPLFKRKREPGSEERKKSKVVIKKPGGESWGRIWDTDPLPCWGRKQRKEPSRSKVC